MKARQPRRTKAELLHAFDHTDWAHLPGYHKVQDAIRLFVEELEEADIEVYAEDLVDVVSMMSIAFTYPDACHDHCWRNSDPDELPPMPYPHRIDRKGDWLTCHYRCPQCHRTWTCGYAADF